jgi:adhesin transport system outer membrane protein
LALTDETEQRAKFEAAMKAAVAQSPKVLESQAVGLETQAARSEANMGKYPTVDLSLSANRSIAREFSNDPDNVIERSRGPGRVDASASVQQTLFDFGGTLSRINAAKSRVSAAEASLDSTRERVALQAVGAWYDSVSYGYLVYLAEAYLAEQSIRRRILNERIARGISAPSDVARLDSAFAGFEQRIARFRREKEGADARFRQIFGKDTPLPILRAPIGNAPILTREYFAQRAERAATVRTSQAQARAALYDAEAARAATLPSVAVGLDAGRYGLFEPGRTDYDVRARITLRHRLLGPERARAQQAAARALAAQARNDQDKQEARQEAETAWANVEGLHKEVDARLNDYVASRMTRDAELARFRISRGTLFDVLTADNQYFDTGIGYIRSLAEFDAARYVLLARSGDLLDALGIPPATEADFR